MNEDGSKARTAAAAEELAAGDARSACTTSRARSSPNTPHTAHDPVHRYWRRDEAHDRDICAVE